MNTHVLTRIGMCFVSASMTVLVPLSNAVADRDMEYSLPPQANAVAELVRNTGFARRVAGSYFVRLDLEGFPLPLRALATLAADGGAIATDEDDFGFLVGGFHSPKHGAWKRTGDRSLAITVLEFAYDGGGTLTTIFELNFNAKFNEGFHDGNGTVDFKAFLPIQDPLDPEELPVSTGEGTFTFRRVVP